MKQPREYQSEALVALDDARAEGRNSALVVMASGLGKTLTAVFDVEKFYASHPKARVLVLCHASFILEQIRNVFAEEFGGSYTYEVYDGNTVGGPRRADFMFANLRSVFLHKEELFVQNEFDYVIVDEAHHSTARTYRAAIEYFCPKFLLGLTATPNRTDGQPIEDIFGEPVYVLDLVEAIERGLLAGIDYFIEIDQHSQELLLSGNLDYDGLDALLQDNFLSDEEAVKAILRHQQEMDNPTTAIFCQSIAHAEAVQKLMPGAGIVHSRRTDEENEHTLAQFRSGKLQTIISVNMLNEGIDIPRIDLVVFLRMTMSSIVFLQQLGRGLRLVEGKDKVRVLDFVCTAVRLEEVFEIKERFTKVAEVQAEKDVVVEAEADVSEVVATEIGSDEAGEIVTTEVDSDAKVKVELEDATKFNLELNGNSIYTDWQKEDILVCIRKALENRAIMRWREVSDEELLELLRKAQTLVGGESLTCAQYSAFVKAHPMYPSLKTFQDRFGSWYEAVKRAGFKVFQQRGWSDEDLLEIICEIQESIGGEKLTYSLYKRIAKEKGYPSASLFNFRFSSWPHALELAGIGIETRQAWKTASDEELLEALRKVHASFCGKKMSIKKYRDFVKDRPEYPSVNLIMKRFGSWNQALESAGITMAKKGHWVISEAEVLALLRKAQVKIGGNAAITIAKYNELAATDNEYPSSSAIIDQFNGMTWNDIMKKAGLKINQHKKSWKAMPDDEMLELVREVYLLNGERKFTNKRYAELTKGNDRYPGLVALSGRFGSWNELLHRLGLEVNSATPTRNWQEVSDTELLELARTARALLGQKMTQTSYKAFIKGKGIYPTYEMLTRRFGSWAKVSELID